MILGLDVGGTHTDVVLLGEPGNGEKQGLIRDVKVKTDHSDLFHTVLTGIETIIEGIDPNQIRRAVLSTTLTTNAIVQGKVQPVGMIVSAGPGIDPYLFRTNEHYYAVSGAIDHRGRETEPIQVDEIRKIALKFQNAGIRNIGVVGKFSTRNPNHEVRIHDMLKDHFGKIFMGHRISGNLNFPRRIATTYLNAVVRPIHKRFFEAVQNSLDKKGLSIPIHVLKADGGTMSLEASLEFPGQTILSGPAASVMGAVAFADNRCDSLVLDVGGTTTDMAVLMRGVPVLEPLGIEIGSFKTLLRSLQTRSIGIGGDSTVRVKKGQLQIGPDREGPAMAHGGPVPTPTDAMVVLGLEPDSPADVNMATKGIQKIARQLKCSVEDTAQMIFDRTCQTILDEAQKMVAHINSKPVYTVQEIQEGELVRPKKILVLGGPAFTIAKHLSQLSGMEAMPVPKWKVANAIGAALARTTCEVTFLADTEMGVANAPEEGYREKVEKNFTQEDAVKAASAMLREKALRIGAGSEDLEFEVIESQQFNMIRGFSTTGKNIRTKVQVKPGLIHDYRKVTQNLAKEMRS